MNPLASAAAAQYQTVFGVETIPQWVCIPSLLIGVFGLASVIVRLVYWKSPRYGLAWIAIAIALLQAVVILSINKGQGDTLHDRISANIQQKYGATLDDNAVNPTSDIDLSQSYKYLLVFPDGAKSEYSIRFDRNTSEPFVVIAPSPDQLAQNAKK